MSPLTPEQRARVDIDAALVGAGWVVQDRDGIDLSAGSGVAVRELTHAQHAAGLDGAGVRSHHERLVDEGRAVTEGQRRGMKYRRADG